MLARLPEHDSVVVQHMERGLQETWYGIIEDACVATGNGQLAAGDWQAWKRWVS